MRALGRILVLGVLAAASSCTLVLGTFEDVGTGGGSTATSSSSGATSSSTGSSSSGGCSVPSDCPAPPACMAATCDAGKCGTTAVAAGMPSGQQTKGDCQQLVCDDSGDAVAQDDDTDVPDDGNPCTADACVNGAAVLTPVAGSCGGGNVCGDPAGPNAGICVTASCSDGVKNGGESDVDCGGATCPKCAFAKACAVDGDCVTGFCVANLCGSFVVATSPVDPYAIALDATNVYWASAGTTSGQGLVGKVPKTGGASVQLAANQALPSAIAVQGGQVYWMNFGSGNGNGTAFRVPTGGGTPSQIVGGLVGPVSIALDSAYVYWASGGRVARAPLAGGTAQTLVTNQNNPLGVAVNATDAYFTNGTQVRRISLATMGVATIATGNHNTAIALDAGNLYWLDTGANKVMRMALVGGTPVSLAALPAGGTIPTYSGIAVSDSDVYFAVAVGMTVSLMKVPITGVVSQPTPLAQNANVRGIAVDAQYVYWASSSDIRKALR